LYILFFAGYNNNKMLSRGILFLFLCVTVFFVLYTVSSDRTVILPGSVNSPAGIALFAPLPGNPILPVLKEERKEGFTVKFAKRYTPQTPMTPVRSIEIQTDCEPPPPPLQNVETVDVAFRHGVGLYQESAPSQAQMVNARSGVQILQFNPLMINNNT
jgi:hypothetical protein